MKRMFLLLLTIFCLPAAQMPPKPTMASLETLPIELKRIILNINSHYAPALNINALAKGILNLAGTNKTIRAQINNLQNIFTILNALPKPAAIYLVEKLGKLPVIQENMLTILQALPKSGAKYLAQALADTPGMKKNEVEKWLQSFELQNSQELSTAIFRAATPSDANFNAIKKILENPNIDINKPDGSGKTPLIFASIICYPEVVSSLLEAGAYPNTTDADGYTPLMSIRRNVPEVVKLLLSAGANVNAKNKKGETALMLFSISGYQEIVKLLLAAGAYVNEKDNKDGDTALMLASRDRHLNVVESLLAADADVNAKNKFGYTAFDKTREPAIIKLLEDAEKTQKEKAARK